MRITQLPLLTLLTIFFNSFSMDEKNHFDTIPTNLLPSILTSTYHQYPWQDFIHAHKLKNVCTSWRDSIGNTDALATKFNIPPMHCAAMMNKPDKIIELKLAGHSPCAPDMHELIPMDYALGCGQADALTLLRIGNATFTHRLQYARQGDEKIIDIITAPRTNQYKEVDLSTAIIVNNYERAVTILFDSTNLCTLKMLDDPRFFRFKKVTNLLLYAAQCMMEDILFENIRKKKNSNEDFFEVFTGFNANPNAYSSDGSTFLHRIAWKQSLLPTFQQLLKLKNIDINLPHLVDEYYAIQCCAATNIEGLKLLLETKKSKSEPFFDHDHSALSVAACNDDANCLSLLIEHGGNVNILDKDGSSPLHYAAVNNQFECLLEILNAPECIIDILDSDGHPPLTKTMIGKNDNVTMMNSLIARGAKADFISQNNCSLISIAAFNGAEKCLKRLLELADSKQHLNKHQFNTGYTPLIDATIRKHLSCIKLLLNAGATIDAIDNWGQTALHFAASKGFDEAIPLLIKHGANVNYVSGLDYIPPLHFAASKGFDEAIPLLINHEANVDSMPELEYIPNTRDGNYTPLNFAAEYGHLNAVKLLIQHGADTNIKTQLGKTALDLAHENDRLEIIELLSADTK